MKYVIVIIILICVSYTQVKFTPEDARLLLKGLF